MAKKTYVAAIDGAPGIMPGIMTFETLVEFEDDEPTSAPRIKEEFQVRRGKPIPMHKRRMMPCNKKNKKDYSLSLFQSGTLVYEGSVFFNDILSLHMSKFHYNI